MYLLMVSTSVLSFDISQTCTDHFGKTLRGARDKRITATTSSGFCYI